MTKPIPRQSRTRKPFLGEIARAFLIVNGLAWIGIALASPGFRTSGANASAKRDPATGKPRVEALQGCEIVTKHQS